MSSKEMFVYGRQPLHLYVLSNTQIMFFIEIRNTKYSFMRNRSQLWRHEQIWTPSICFILVPEGCNVPIKLIKLNIQLKKKAMDCNGYDIKIVFCKTFHGLKCMWMPFDIYNKKWQMKAGADTGNNFCPANIVWKVRRI